jgi:hypothetical protein
MRTHARACEVSCKCTSGLRGSACTLRQDTAHLPRQPAQKGLSSRLEAMGNTRDFAAGRPAAARRNKRSTARPRRRAPWRWSRPVAARRNERSTAFRRRASARTASQPYSPRLVVVSVRSRGSTESEMRVLPAQLPGLDPAFRAVVAANLPQRAYAWHCSSPGPVPICCVL